MQRFSGKTVIVTGAASGIGRASAELFAAEGAAVLAADLSGDVNAVAAAIRNNGGNAEAVLMDAGSSADVERIVALAETRYGGLDVFHANAGISGGTSTIIEESEEAWHRILQVNLIGPMLAIRSAAPAAAKRGGGAIVVTASAAGLRPTALASPAYCASKAAVISLVQMAAIEFANSNVRINAVCPGLIETKMTRRIFEGTAETRSADAARQFPGIQRAGRPEEIARTVLFLASDDASYIKGVALLADGGPRGSSKTR